MEKEALKIKHFTPVELELILTEDENFQQAIRLFACYQVSLGIPPQEVAIIYGTSYRSICDWVHRLNKGGIEALVDNEKPSRTNGFIENNLQSIKEIVIQTQLYDYGFDNRAWTWSTLSKVMMHQFQISYKKAQLYNYILQKLGRKF